MENPGEAKGNRQTKNGWERARSPQQQVHEPSETVGDDQPDYRRDEHRHNHFGHYAGRLEEGYFLDDARGVFGRVFEPDDGIPIASGGGQRRAAQTADERMAGTARQANVPG